MLKVLIVEDEYINAMSLKNKLIALGYKVVNIVSNFNDTIKEIENNDIKIVFMDINLKGSELDGIDTTKEINKINKNIQIIYLTAFSDELTLLRAAKTNYIGYITKPYNDKQLESIIFLAIETKKHKSECKLLLENLSKDSETMLDDSLVLLEHINVSYKYLNEYNADELLNFISLIKKQLESNVKVIDSIHQRIDNRIYKKK